MTTSGDGTELFRKLAPDAFAALHTALCEVSPDLMEMAARFPFGEIYQRAGISKRDRQLVTLAALATRGDASSQLKVHIGIALRLGLTQQEIAEAFIQLVPYAGFPTAINATLLLKEVLGDQQSDDG